MKNVRVPIRPAPSVEEARQKQNQQNYNFLARFQPKDQQQQRKKPPPRPPPPNLDKVKSSSTWNLHNLATSEPKHQQPPCLIDWSPPVSPNASSKRVFAPFLGNSCAGSISSSFSGSTSSLASSKKSFEYDTTFNISPWTSSQRVGPTIIRAQISKKTTRNASPVSLVLSNSSSPVLPASLPPPPSPPKLSPADDEPEVSPFAIALYEYRTGHPDDLVFQVNDIVYLTERINDEWYRGRVDVQEGMFPVSFVDVQVPLSKPVHQCTVQDTYTPNVDGYLNI